MSLTIRQNLLETIHHGNPDRLVKQFEYQASRFDPIFYHGSMFCKRGEAVQNEWGYWVTWPQDVIACFPMHDAQHLLLPDITEWEHVIKGPDPWAIPDEEWEEVDAFYASIDREEYFATAQLATGIFEKVHSFMGVDNACVAFLEEPEAMHELIDYLVDWEIECAKVQIQHLHPDALFHHDDFGTQISTFMSPATFREFFVPAYKKLYGFWRENGIELIVHHSDSYAATLVPDFIDMGIDIWQGVLDTNNIPQLIEDYGDRIAFHGGMNNGTYDHEATTPEILREGLRKLIDATGIYSIIPAMTAGGPVTSYRHVYPMLDEEIDRLSKELFH